MVLPVPPFVLTFGSKKLTIYFGTIYLGMHVAVANLKDVNKY